MAGRQSEITQYAIATNALHRPPDFEAGENPLIRVQAGRLRDQLSEYYLTEGRFDPIRIDLPLGSYCPTFQWQTDTAFQLPSLREGTAFSQSSGPGVACIPRNFMTNEAVGWAFITRLTRDYVTALTHFSFCQVMFADENLYRQTSPSEDIPLQCDADFILFFDLHVKDTHNQPVRGYTAPVRCGFHIIF
ncbi:hypothetical protein [Thiothrix nivea]|uniref:hypothetical protein n=1 Tax=Thiothrix nivea TaxID=1031 RepID=UPI000594A14C|nr:hypothetical protein [Thiothrix nivea]